MQTPCTVGRQRHRLYPTQVYLICIIIHTATALQTQYYSMAAVEHHEPPNFKTTS